MLAGLWSAWAMVSLTRILRGRPWAWSGEQAVPVLIAPDLRAFLDPDHVVAPGAAKLGIAALPGVGEDPGVQRLSTALALVVGALEHARPDHGQPLAAVQVAKLGADRHQSSFHSRPRRSLGASARFWRVPR